MASMMTLLEGDVIGMWFSEDKQFTLWISKNQQRVEVYFNRKPILSEPFSFFNNGEGFDCKVSDSVTVTQLFNCNTDELFFHINTADYGIKQWFIKRNL